MNDTIMPISTVHDALSDALVEAAKGSSGLRHHRDPRINLTVRLHPEKKLKLKEICEAHGISPSNFFRSCADSLLRDYMGPTSFDAFEASLWHYEERKA